MSSLHKRAMDAVLQAADMDVLGTLEERGIKERHSEEADEAALDVATLHAYRVFMRICEAQGVEADAFLFAELAQELAEEVAQEGDMLDE
ncbi:hypothetical protein [Indioceanicola profundi]|uniref:hypothetical protein n=1 Tax=Indioceanicola profundi TaxID=2220096 RepID=UPI000E6ACE2F|nr:hypothetical protein [Indioceanicola profundi]